MKGIDEIKICLQDEEWPLDYTDHVRGIVRGIVFDDEGYFYFVRLERNDIFCNGRLIETAGGGVEKGEALDVAIKRELNEELGVEVEIVCKIGVVEDYYNLIHRKNVNNYYLCKAVSFGDRHLTEDEESSFHLTTQRLSYQQAVEEYESAKDKKLGRLIANRELPILHQAKLILDNLNKVAL